MKKVLALVAAATAMLAVAATAQTARFADTIFFNARIWTVDPKQPEAEAVAISGGRIVAVGPNDVILKRRGPVTRVDDLHGARVLPGFNDAHTHFENATQWFYEVRLVDVNDDAEMLDRLRKTASRVPAGMWITAIDMSGKAGWAAQKKKDATFRPLEPKLSEVDAAAGDHPVLLKRFDGAAFANSAAMKIARLNEHVPDLTGGSYGRDAVTGKLTGMLYGKAAQSVANMLPPATMASKVIAARGVLHQMNAFGLTSIHDIAKYRPVSELQTYTTDVERSYTDVDIFRSLEKSGELTVRVYAYQPLRSFSQLAQFDIKPGSGDQWIRFGILKDFADSGWMLEPYSNHPDYSGDVTFRFTSDAEERALIAAADRAGWDLGIHTIGDKALQTVLGWYSDAEHVNGPRADRRDRIIHMWYANPELIQRAGKMGLIADVTPYQLLSNPAEIEQEIGPERSKWAFAWRSMIDAGMRLNLVSDMPGLYSRMDISPYNPIENIYYATTRQDMHGKPAGGWHPEQVMTLKEAIAAYTINPAYASHEEALKGSISEGKYADLVVLSRDILAGSPQDLLKTTVIMTMVGGKIVYQSR